MLIGVLALLLIAAILAVIRESGRRSARRAQHSLEPAVEILLEPADLQALAVPVLSPVDAPNAEGPQATSPPAVQRLDRVTVFRKLNELALGVAQFGSPPPEHAGIAAAAVAAMENESTRRQYAPRRPNLLPQLLQAANNDEISRRELASIISRDPSLVGSLLTMANSSYYRVTQRPVESIDRAVVLLGSEGIRSLIAAAVMQPIFRLSNKQFPRFPEIVWDRALRSANAAVAHAAVVEKADPFAAELLSLVTGLAEIMLFRATLDQYATRPGAARFTPDPAVIAGLLATHVTPVAQQIGVQWELSERILVAFEEQTAASAPRSPLGRSLLFGRVAGALAMLFKHHRIDEAVARASLPDEGWPPEQLERMWTRLTHEPPAAKAAAKKPPRVASNGPRHAALY